MVTFPFHSIDHKFSSLMFVVQKWSEHENNSIYKYRSQIMVLFSSHSFSTETLGTESLWTRHPSSLTSLPRRPGRVQIHPLPSSGQFQFPPLQPRGRAGCFYASLRLPEESGQAMHRHRRTSQRSHWRMPRLPCHANAHLQVYSHPVGRSVNE